MKRSIFCLLLLPLLLACSTPNNSVPLVSSSTIDNGGAGQKFVYQNPKSDAIMSLSAETASTLGFKSLESLSGLLQGKRKNFVLSPASYALALAGFAGVSDRFDNASFGLGEDALQTMKDLLIAWNFDAHSKKEYGYETDERHSQFQAMVVHQQAGETYAFDEAKRQQLSSDFVATIVSSLKDYHSDAASFFQEELGFNIPVPDPKLTTDGVLTYGAFKMKDCVPGGLSEAKKPFLGRQVDATYFGSDYVPEFLPVYEGKNYVAFRFDISCSHLVIVLPNEGVSIDSVNPATAYQEFKDGASSVATKGYIPYFHIQTLEEDLTSTVANKLTGQEVFYSKLLREDVKNDLQLCAVLQSNDYEFSKDGICGESITVMATCGSAMFEGTVMNLEVNRPFYAFSEKDGFPLFAAKVLSL